MKSRIAELGKKHGGFVLACLACFAGTLGLGYLISMVLNRPQVLAASHGPASRRPERPGYQGAVLETSCSAVTIDEIPQEHLRESGFKDSAALLMFLARNQLAWNRIREALNPEMKRRVAAMEGCLHQQGLESDVALTFQWHLKATPGVATASRFAVRRVDGQQTRPELVKQCFGREFDKPIVAPVKPGSGGALHYDALYPRPIALKFKGSPNRSESQALLKGESEK
jgi:hypothetical protein